MKKKMKNVIIGLVDFVLCFFMAFMMVCNFLVCGLAMLYAYALRGFESDLFLVCFLFFIFSNLIFVSLFNNTQSRTEIERDFL